MCAACTHAHVGMFLCVCICSSVHAHTGFNLCTHVECLNTQQHSYVRVQHKPYFEHFSSFSICSSTICNFKIIPLFFCIQLYVPCHISSYYESNITFPSLFSPNHEFNLILFFAGLPPYSGKRSTNRVLIWYRILIKETRGHIRASGFKLIIRLLPERSANVTLVHTLAERWWDTTHTFHIGDREMTIAPHDFHMTDLRIDGAWINLEGEQGTRLGLELLRRRYATETIRYTDLEENFMHHPQGTAKECVRMAKVFLLYLLGILICQWVIYCVLEVGGLFPRL